VKYKIKVREYIFREPTSDLQFTSPEKVFEILRDDFNPLQEELYLLIMNLKNQALEKHLIYRSGIGSVIINPSDIFRRILMTAGSHFIIAHNHPSGDPAPSEEDVHMTRKLSEGAALIGLRLLDHIIFTNDNFFSFKSKDML